MELPELSTTEFGLVGHPLGHSYSKQLFESWHRSYANFDLAELTPATLYNLILLNPRLKGFNVTAPYKESIKPFLDNIDPLATAVGAVNTVKIRRSDDGRLLGLDGYNTDYIGFKTSVGQFLDPSFVPMQALILGTGGAAKAVAAVLKDLGINFKYVSRTHTGSDTTTYGQLNDASMSAYGLIINATPLGTYPDTGSYPPIPYGGITANHKCLDLVYNPTVTEFMKRCAANGAAVKNGLEMLECQARESLKIWENQ